MRHKDPAPDSPENLRRAIDEHIATIDLWPRFHGKLKFLLDIRRILEVNGVRGDYVEFGVYRGEMMYAAGKILHSQIERLVGLDTFAGLPDPVEDDAERFVFGSQGFMASPRSIAETVLDGQSLPHIFVVGDFREPEIRAEYCSCARPIAVLTIDSDWKSSIAAALEMSGEFLQCGSFLYLDDYFVGTRKRNFHEELLSQTAQRNDLRFVDFLTYPPFGRAFLVER